MNGLESGNFIPFIFSSFVIVKFNSIFLLGIGRLGGGGGGGGCCGEVEQLY